LSTVLDNQTELNTENTSGDRNSSPTTKKNLVSRLGSLDKGELSLSLSLSLYLLLPQEEEEWPPGRNI